MEHTLEQKYPLFFKTCLSLESTFFYRNIFELCERIPVDYTLAEKLCRDALAVCDGDWEVYRKKLDSLLELNIEFLKLQALLEKSGSYLYSTFKEVEEEVFRNKHSGAMDGVGYLWGLYFSQIFWVTHHRMFGFFLREFVHSPGSVLRCLDVPVGSGMFSAQLLLAHPECNGIGIDLSKSATDFAQNLFSINDLIGRSVLLNKDFFAFEGEGTFDRIICTEFIEHVEDPLAVLRKLRTLLSDSGKIFLTTVAWAAQVDHIYLYKSAQEIRDHLVLSGFVIEKEYVQNIFDKDAGKLEDNKVALNYAAILTKTL